LASVNPNPSGKLFGTVDAWLDASEVKLEEEIPEKSRSEPPDNTSGGTIVIFNGAGVIGADAVALHAPGEIMEVKSIVHATANIDGDRVVSNATGINFLHSGHGMNEWPPASKRGGEARTGKKVVLGNFSGCIAAIEAAGIEYHSEVGKTRRGERFGGGIPASIALRISSGIIELAVGNAAVNISRWKQLCLHRNR